MSGDATELVDALTKILAEMRKGFENQERTNERLFAEIEKVQTVTAEVHRNVEDLRSHLLEQVDTFGRRVKQVENVTSTLTKQAAAGAQVVSIHGNGGE